MKAPSPKEILEKCSEEGHESSHAYISELYYDGWIDPIYAAMLEYGRQCWEARIELDEFVDKKYRYSSFEQYIKENGHDCY